MTAARAPESIEQIQLSATRLISRTWRAVRLGALGASTKDLDQQVVLGEVVQHLKDSGIAVLEEIDQ